MFPSVVDPRDERLDEIEHRLAELSGLVNAAQGEMVELVGEALDEGLWQGWGIHTPAQWFAWKTGTSPHHARQVVKLAERRTSGRQAVHRDHVAAVELVEEGDAGVERAVVEAGAVQRRRAGEHGAHVDEGAGHARTHCGTSGTRAAL